MRTYLISFLLGLSLLLPVFAEPESRRDYKFRMGLEKKAIQGDVLSMFHLGNFYQLNRAPKLARKWYQKAADQDHGPSLWKLADLCYEKSGKIDYDTLIKTYQNLAKLGETRAYVFLGDIYLNKLSGHYNLKQAVLHYQDAAHAKESEAMTQLGKLYMGKMGHVPDYPQAIRWLLKAAKLNVPESMRYLGICYQYGLGLQENFDKAWIWYSRGAQHGDSECMYILAEALFYGKGIQKDKARAKQYYEKAARFGHYLAKGQLRKLNFDKVHP